MTTPSPVVKVYYGKVLLPDVSRVLACLYEKDVKFDLIDMYAGQRMNPDLIKFQASRAPVSGFEDGDTRLFESRATCRYIIDKYADRGNKYLLGRDLLERASIEQWLKSEEHSFDPPSWAMVFHLAFNVQPDRALIAESERRLSKVLDVYEQRLGESKFLAGDEFSLADLSHLPNSHYLARSKRWGHLFESRKNVNKWWEEISSRHSWQEVVKLLNEFGLLKDADVSSDGTYHFLNHNKLDLHSSALEAVTGAPSNHEQEQTTQPTIQEDLINQQAPTIAPISTQPAVAASPSSQTQMQNAQLERQADSTGQSTAQQTQSSNQLQTDVSTSNEKQGQKEQPTHQADSNQLIDEQTASQPASTGAPLNQAKLAQQARQVDSNGQSSAKKTTPDTPSSTPLPSHLVGDEQEKHTQKMRQADAPSQGLEQTTQQTTLNAEQEKTDATTSVQQGSPGKPIPRGQVTQSTTGSPTSGPYDATSRKMQGQQAEPIGQADSPGQPISPRPTTDSPPTLGAQPGQNQESNVQQTSDQTTTTPDVQTSTDRGSPGAQLTGQADTEGQPISQQGTFNAQTSLESPSPEEKSSQKKEQEPKQTSEERSTKTVVSQGPTEATLPAQQGSPTAISNEEQEKNVQATGTTREADSPGQSNDQKHNAEGESSNPPKSAGSTPQSGTTGGSNRQSGPSA